MAGGVNGAPRAGLELPLGASADEDDGCIQAAAEPAPPGSSTGKRTARTAITILTGTGLGFVEPTPAERSALGVAFAMNGKVLYGAAYDVVRFTQPMDLSDPAAISTRLGEVTVCEIKSTNRASLTDDFSGYFFDLTTAELLVAQSLGQQYLFAFVNTLTGRHLELSLNELFARARKIYPKWAVRF